MERGGALIAAREETVGDADGVAVAPALQTAHKVAAVGDGAAVDGVADGEVRRQGVTHQTAAVVVGATGCGDGDVGGYLTAVDGVGATGESHEGGGMDGACDAAREEEVLDGGPLNVAEEGGALVLGVTDVDGERLAAAVVGAAEVVGLAGAYRREVAADADFGSLAEGLSAAVGTAVDGCGQVAQVGLGGYLIGSGASLVGGEEELVA